MVKVIAIGGEPASGKTTLMFELIKTVDDWTVCKPQKLLDAMYSKKLNLYVLGKYDNSDNVFQGTDRLSMAVQPDASKFFSELSCEDSNANVIFEGDRLFNGKMLDYLQELFPDSFKVLILTASHKIKEQRHVDRNDSQDEKFKNSRQTKIENIMSSLTLMGYIQTLKNETYEEQKKNLSKIQEFFLIN
jgi:hypothetical protein